MSRSRRLQGRLAVVSGITFERRSPRGHSSAPRAATSQLQTSGITLKPNPSQMNTGSDFIAATCSSANPREEHRHAAGSASMAPITSRLTAAPSAATTTRTANSTITGPYQGRGTSTCAAENPSNILITHVLFHDVQWTNAPRARTPDCLQFFGNGKHGGRLEHVRALRNVERHGAAEPPDSGPGNTLDVLTFTNNSFSPATFGGAEVVAGLSETTSAGGLHLHRQQRWWGRTSRRSIAPRTRASSSPTTRSAGSAATGVSTC